MPALGDLFNKLLAFDDGNEVYELRLDREPYVGLVGMTCREVMNCVPVAIVIAVQRGWVKLKEWSRGKSASTPKYVSTVQCGELQKGDRLLIIARELHHVELHVRSLGLNSQFKSVKFKASEDIKVRREKSTELVTKRDTVDLKVLGKRFGTIAKDIDKDRNYSWLRAKRKIVIMGWAGDLFDLLNTFLRISVVAWPGDDCLDVEVHILGGPRRQDARIRFWKQYTSLSKIEILDDGKLIINVRDEDGHDIVVFHYPGRNSRARYINTLPLSTARSILILSDDDNESALASDSQCLTNLMLVSELYKAQCRESRKRKEVIPNHLHVVCEILDPHTPKMVQVQPLKNPFMPFVNDIHVDVLFFCTNMLETAMFALSCYNPLLTDFHKRTVRTIAGLKNHDKSWSLPKFTILQLSSLFVSVDNERDKERKKDPQQVIMWKLAAERFSKKPYSNGCDARYEKVKAELRNRWGKDAINANNKERLKYLALNKGMEKKHWPRKLSFNDIDQILSDTHKMTLIGWQRLDENDPDVNINPIDKDATLPFGASDLLIVL